jgi:hypothetical protein
MARVVWRLATWLAHRGIVPCPETGLAPARVGGRKPTRTHGRESACSMSTTHDTVARILDDPGWQRIQVRQRPTCGRCRDRELAHRRESRLSRMRSRSGGRATGVVIVRVPHRNAPTSGGRTPTTPHAPGRAGPWCTRAAQPPGVAVAWVGLTAAGHCSSPHAGEPRSLHVSSGGPVGADRGPASPRDDPRCDPPSHLVDHRERPAGRNRLRSARNPNGKIEPPAGERRACAGRSLRRLTGRVR